MRKILLISFLFILFFSLIPIQTQAAGLVPCGGEGEPDCQFCHFFVMTNGLIKFVMLKLAPVIAVLMLVVGGILLLFAGAKPDTLRQAKGIITSVIIGLVIIFSAWIIINTVLAKSGIVKSPALLQWYNIECSIK